MAGDARGRVWATILYTESVKEGFRDIIKAWHIPALLSPLHDEDINEDGSKKKPHYHLMIWFEGKKSRDQIKEIFAEVGGVGVEKVLSKVGMARYLCHLDDPLKAQYSVEEVLAFSNADYYFLISSDIDRLRSLKEMEDWVDANGVVLYAALSKYAREERPDWYRILTKSATIHMTQYLKSKQYERREKEKERYYAKD